MRWSIIRLIWLRDLRDQLRDRRTVFMIALLPLFLYPVLGMAAMRFLFSFVEKPSVIGIVGSPGEFPAREPGDGSLSPAPAVAWLALTPTGPGPLGAASLSKTASHFQDYPVLVAGGRFVPAYLGKPGEELLTAYRSAMLRVRFLPTADRAPLEAKEVDLILSAPEDFWARLKEDGGRAPWLRLQVRPEDERSRLAQQRIEEAVARWKNRLKEVRLVRRGLPADFDDPVEVREGEKSPVGPKSGQGFADLMLKIFPFMLVMWSLAGALYPAVDVCAGEKERGTMETLLISPASRQEIVLGKFLTIWVFSAATSLLNLVSMSLTATMFNGLVPGEILRPMGLVWCVVLLLPLSAFFSAVCLAIGAYARSTKEGQYYLMPLFLVSMPLIFLTLAPGVELNPFYSLVPVTGVALLMQRLMGATPLAAGTGLYFLPVLVPIALYSILALRWAIEQFRREEVLFREAERLEIRLWLRGLFRHKEMLPSTGQAFFCFALVMGLRWLSTTLGGRLPELAQLAIIQLAFVATPAVLMALLLTTRPRQALALTRPRTGDVLTSLALAAVVVGPLVQLTLFLFDRLAVIREMAAEQHRLLQVLEDLNTGAGSSAWALLSLVVLPALCEEVAFRGFLLTGLRRRFPAWTAIGLSSFLFALYPMNVFQFVPTFLLGVVLALLTVRSNSIWPAVFFHLLHNGLLVGSTLLPRLVPEADLPLETLRYYRLVITGLCTLLAGLLFWRLALRTPLPAQPAQPE